MRYTPHDSPFRRHLVSPDIHRLGCRGRRPEDPGRLVPRIRYRKSTVSRRVNRTEFWRRTGCDPKADVFSGR